MKKGILILLVGILCFALSCSKDEVVEEKVQQVWASGAGSSQFPPGTDCPEYVLWVSNADRYLPANPNYTAVLGLGAEAGFDCNEQSDPCESGEIDWAVVRLYYYNYEGVYTYAAMFSYTREQILNDEAEIPLGLYLFDVNVPYYIDVELSWLDDNGNTQPASCPGDGGVWYAGYLEYGLYGGTWTDDPNPNQERSSSAGSQPGGEVAYVAP